VYGNQKRGLADSTVTDGHQLDANFAVICSKGRPEGESASQEARGASCQTRKKIARIENKIIEKEKIKGWGAGERKKRGGIRNGKCTLLTVVELVNTSLELRERRKNFVIIDI